MKKVILGSFMMLGGLLSAALLLAGSMASQWTVNGLISAMGNIYQFGLMPALFVFSGIAVAGLLLAVWGLLEKE